MSNSSTSRYESENRRYQPTAQTIMSGSKCRHLNSAGNGLIMRCPAAYQTRSLSFCNTALCTGLERCFDSRSRPPSLDGAVNKRFLSTGETGEFASENVGFGLNPVGFSLGSHDASRPTGENARRAKTYGMLRIRAREWSRASVNETRPSSWGKKVVAPRETWFPTTSPRPWTYQIFKNWLDSCRRGTRRHRGNLRVW